MNTSNTLISLGDMIRAFGILQPTDDMTRQAIVAMLDIQEQKSPQEQPLPVAVPSFTPLSPVQEEPLDESPASNVELSLPTSSPVPSTLEKEGMSILAKRLAIDPLPEEPAVRANPPTPDPLFFPAWRRCILSTALATYSDNGVPDIDSLIKSLVLMEPIERIPGLLGPTLRRGVQVLVDRSTALTPFSADQDEMLQAIVQLVGAERTQVSDFTDSPLQRISDPYQDQVSYRPPPSGTIVALLTDLGIGQTLFLPRRSTSKEWLTFSTKLRRAGCPAVAFVPYAPKRWPEGMSRTLKIIFWDRSTTISKVHNLMRSRRGRML